MASIGFIGVGKLGQACAEMVAEVHDVVGYDVNHVEPENFTMVDNMEDAVKKQDIVFISVPTPHDPQYDGKAPTSHLPNKDFDYSVVKDVLAKVNAVATKEQLIVLISTVLPGTVRREFIPLLTNTRFVYNPYLIAMGTVKWDMVNPEMVMIGTRDGSETGDAKELVDFYKTIMQNDPRYIIGTWDECECIKVFYNTFISAKVSLVNMIQDVAEKQGNINAEVVCDALADCDRRIMGPSYMKPGMGDGGACHPRDNIALSWLARKLDLSYDWYESLMICREKQTDWLADLMEEHDLPKVILGRAFKPETNIVVGSPAVLLRNILNERGHDVVMYDPRLGDELPEFEASCFLIGCKHPEFAEFDFPEGSIVIDPHRYVKEKPGVTVIHIGG